MRILIRCLSNLSLDRRTSTLSSAAPSFESVHGRFPLWTDSDKMATAKNKLRNLIMVSERKRGSVPYRLALAWQAHASGMHSRFCDTVGQNCGLAVMSLSHVEDETEPPTTRFAQSFHPSRRLNMVIVGMVAVRDLVAGFAGNKGEAQQGCRSLVPALAVNFVNSTQNPVCWASLHFCGSRDDIDVGLTAGDTSM